MVHLHIGPLYSRLIVSQKTEKLKAQKFIIIFPAGIKGLPLPSGEVLRSPATHLDNRVYISFPVSSAQKESQF